MVEAAGDQNNPKKVGEVATETSVASGKGVLETLQAREVQKTSGDLFSAFEGIKSALTVGAGEQRSVSIDGGARIQLDDQNRLLRVFDSNGGTVEISYEGNTTNVKSLKYADGSELKKMDDGRWQRVGKDGNPQGSPFKGDVKVEDRLKGILSIDNRDTGVREFTDPRGGITVRELYSDSGVCTLDSQPGQSRTLNSTLEFKNGVLQKVTDGLTGKEITGDEIKTFDPAKPETDPKIPGVTMQPGDSFYKMPGRDGSPESTIILRKDGSKIVVQGGNTTEFNVYNQETRRLDSTGAELSRTIFDESGKVKGFSQKGIGEFLITGSETVDDKVYSKFELQGKTPPEYILGNMKVNPDGSRVFESPTGTTTISKDGIKTVVDSKTGQIQVMNGKDVIASQTSAPDGKLTISVGDKYNFVQEESGFTDTKSGKKYADVRIDSKTGKIILTDATTLAQVAIDAKGGTEQAIGSDRDARIVRSSEPAGEILQTRDAFDRTTTFSYETADGKRFLSTIKTPTESWQLQKDSLDPKTGIGLWSNGIDKPQRMKMTVDDKGTLRMEYVDDSKGKVRELNTAGQERVVYSGLQNGAELLNNQIDVLVRPDGSKMPVYRGSEGIVAVENSEGTLLVSKGQVTEEMKAKYGDKITEVLPGSIRVNDSGDITYKEATGGDRLMGNWITEKMSSVKDPATGKYMMTRITWEGDPSQGKWSSIYMPQVDEKGNVSQVGIIRENTTGVDVYHYINPKTGERTEPGLSRVNYDSNLNQLTVQKDRMGQTEVFDQNGRKISIRGDNGRVDIKYDGDKLTPSEVTTTQGAYVRVQNADGTSGWQRKANLALKQDAGAVQSSVELPEGFVLNAQGQVVSKESLGTVTTNGVCTVDGDITEKTIKYPDGRTEVIKYVDKPVVDDNGEKVTERTVTREDGTKVVTRFNDKGERLQTLYKNDKGLVTVAEGQGVTTWFSYDDKGQVKAIVSTDSRLNREMQPDGTWKGPNGIEKWNSVTVDKNTGWTVYSNADLTRTVFTYGFVKDTKADGSSVVDMPGGTGAQYNINSNRPIEVDTTDPKNVVVKAGDLKIGTFDGANVEQSNGNTFIYKMEGGVRVLDKVITGDKIITYKDGKPETLQQVVASTQPGGARYELKTLTGTNFKTDVLGNTVVLDDKGNKLVVYSGDKTIRFKTEVDNFKETSSVDVVTDASTGNTYRQTPEGVEITGPDGKKQLVKNAHLKYENATLQLTDGINTISLNGTRQIYEDSSGITVYNTDGSIIKVNSTTGHAEIIKYEIKDGKIVSSTQSFRGNYQVTQNGDFLLYNTESGSMTTFKATGEPSLEVSREITATFRDGSFTIDKKGNLIYTPNDTTKGKIEVGRAVVNTETGTPIITAEYSKAAYEYFKNTGVATRQIVLGAPGTNAPYVIEENGKLYHVDKLGIKTEFKGTINWDGKPPTISVDNPNNDPKIAAVQLAIASATERSAQIVFAKTQDIKEERFKPVLDSKGNVVRYEQVADMPTSLTLRSGEKVDLTKLGFGVASTSTERNTTADKVPVLPAANLNADPKGQINPNTVIRDIIGADVPKVETSKGVFGPSIAATVDQAAELKKNDLTVRVTQVMDTVSLDVRKAFVNSGGVIPENATPAERVALQTLVERSKAMDISAPKLLERVAEYKFNLMVGDTKAYLDPKFVGSLANDPALALSFNPKIAGVTLNGFSPSVPTTDGVPLPVNGAIETLRRAAAERAITDLKTPGDVLTTAQRNQFEFDKATLSAAYTIARTDVERAAIMQAIQNLTIVKNSTSEVLRETTLNFANFMSIHKGVITSEQQPEVSALLAKFQAAKLVNDQVLEATTTVAAGIKQATASAEKIEELRTQLARIQTSENTAVTKAEIEKQILQERAKLIETLNAALKPIGLEVVHSPDAPNGTSGAIGKYVIETRPLDTSGLPPHLAAQRPSEIDISRIEDPGQRAIVAALQVRELTSAAMRQYVETVLTIGALNRSAMDFLPNFMLTGDLNPIKSASSTPFTQNISSLPVDLNTKVSTLTGRGMNTIFTADGTIISIERALANPTLLAQLLATNQISINTLNGLLASADLVRILNIAVAGGLSYTQLTNFSNPELAKYFGTTADGIKMGFNVQVGYASGLVYTSQNGVLVPARLSSLEDGIFIQSLQGQKTITEAIKSNSGFVTISNGKNRSDEDDEDEDEEDDGVVVSGSKEDFGGKIPTAQPVTQSQTTASQDPTAVLASNQPVPLPDFLILPDGSMEPMPAEWKTKANHEHGHVDVIDENGKHVHVIDSKGNVLTEQQIEKARKEVAAAKAAEVKTTSTDFSPMSPEASLNIPFEISDFNANFGIENQGQAAYIDNDIKQADDLNNPLAYIQNLPIDASTGFPYDPDTGYILNPNTGDIIGNINDQISSLSTAVNPFDGRMIDPVTGFPYDPSTGVLYDPLSGNPVGSVTPEADPIIDLSNDIAMIQDNMESRLDDISAYSHVQDALNDAQDIDDVHADVASDLATRPEGLDFGTDEDYKEKEKERLDNILNQLEEEEKRLEEQEDELRKRRDEIERLTKLMNSLLATRRQAELDRIRRLIEQQRKIEEFIAKDIRRIKYTVRKGDTLENIAKKHFRDPRLARLIYEMNPAKIKLSQEEGKTAYELTINSVLTLPSPRQAREWISRGKYLTAVDNSYVAQTELTADDLANMEKRRLNVENVLGALGMAADTNYKPSYTVRFGDSLRSIAMKHPALNDVSLWRLLAKVNELSIETDAMGTPKVHLERGMNLTLPSKEEIAQFRKDNGALVHPSSLKQGANGPADLVTNVTVFKECPSCKENTPAGVSLCHCCGHVFQESASGIGPDTKISTVSKQVTLTNIGGASTEHDPLAPKQEKDEKDNVHTLNLPEVERKVANSDVSPLPKTEVDPKGVANVSSAAKSDITLKLNDPLASKLDIGITNTGASSDAFLNSMSSMQKSRRESFSIPSHKYNMSKIVENLSDTSRIVLLDSELDSNNQKAERWQLEVLKGDEWTPVVAYEIIGDNSVRHEYNVSGKSRKSIKMNLPSAAVEEMVRNDLSSNWQDYCQKFLSGKKLSQ